MNGHGYPSTKTIEASVDWLTITYRDAKARTEAQERMAARMLRKAADGFKETAWSSYGFDGWSVGGLSYGTRPDCDMIRLSGPDAQEHWKAFYELGGNVTRYDVAVTIWLQRAVVGLGSREFERLNSSVDTDTLHRRYSHVQSTGGGNTLYVGSRSSRWFGRLYDKGVESGSERAGICWRYEVEAKEDAAKSLSADIARSSMGATDIARFVARWFGDRRIAVLFPDDGTGSAIALPRRITDVERKLHWLGEQVSPSVKYLCEMGHRTEVLRILHLQDGVE